MGLHSVNLTEEAENVYKYRQSTQKDFNFSKFCSDQLLDDAGYLSTDQINTKIARMEADRANLAEDIEEWKGKLAYAAKKEEEQGRSLEQMHDKAITILRNKKGDEVKQAQLANVWSRLLNYKYTIKQLMDEANG